MTRKDIERRLDRLHPLLRPDVCPTCRDWTRRRLCNASYEYCFVPMPCPACGAAGPILDTWVPPDWDADWVPAAHEEAGESIAAAQAFTDFVALGPMRSVHRLAELYSVMAQEE
jgi:hypothetical protein